jgi:hypothetical protein
MNTQIFNLENKINELVMRMNNAEQELKSTTSQEINSLRNELVDLIKQFNELKIQLLSDDSEVKITQEDIENLIRLIDDYITKQASNFDEHRFSENSIEDVELSITYSQELEIDNATINVGDYFCKNFYFNFNSFISYVDDIGTDEQKVLVKTFITEEFFEIINDLIQQAVADIDTTPNFCSIYDWECEVGYSKRIDITEVTIDGDEFTTHFNNEFTFPEEDLETAIKQFHNFIEEDDSDDDSEDDSEENTDDNSDDNSDDN